MLEGANTNAESRQVFSTAHTAMLIEPINYLPGSPHRATKQMVQLRSNNGTTAITRYGATPANCAVESVSYIFCFQGLPHLTPKYID